VDKYELTYNKWEKTIRMVKNNINSCYRGRFEVETCHLKTMHTILLLYQCFPFIVICVTLRDPVLPLKDTKCEVSMSEIIGLA